MITSYATPLYKRGISTSGWKRFIAKHIGWFVVHMLVWDVIQTFLSNFPRFLDITKNALADSTLFLMFSILAGVWLFAVTILFVAQAISGIRY